MMMSLMLVLVFYLNLISACKQLTHFYGILTCLVSMLAKALADLARNHSVDTKFDSPFSLEARARVNFQSDSIYI